MSRKSGRVLVYLDTKGIKVLPQDEIRAILRGADDIISSGGRGILAKILKGSRDKKVLEHKLNESPVYGYFKDLSIADITSKIDWMIKEHYLRIEYDFRLPLLVYTERGWEIEKDTYTDELLSKMKDMQRTLNFDLLDTFRGRNRAMMLLLLEKIRKSKDARYIPILEEWKKRDYKKVRQAIAEVIRELQLGE